MRNKIILLSMLIALMQVTVFAQSADDITGLWYGEKDEQGRTPIVEIYKDGSVYNAYAFNYKEGPATVNDVNNPKASERNKPLKGLVYLWGLKFSKNEWTGGKIYNPANGKTFDAKATLNGNKLMIRATVVGIGKTLEYTKIPASEASKYTPLPKNELRKLN